MLAVILLLAGATPTYAQFLAGSTTTFTAAASNPQVRAQGITEVIGDQLFTVTGASTLNTAAATSATATLSVTYNGAITNAATTPGATLTNLNGTLGAAGIQVTFTGFAFTAGTTVLGWNVSGNTLNITMTVGAVGASTLTTTGATIAVHGVRVNASAATGSVTGSVTSAPSNVLFLTGFFNPLTVAIIAPGLNSSTTKVLVSTDATPFGNITSAGAAITAAPTTKISNCTIKAVPTTFTPLTGVTIGTTATNLLTGVSPIGIRIQEGFVGAFTTAAQEVAKSGTEATVGTRIQIDITGVPSQLTLAAPEQISNGALLTMNLVGGLGASPTTIDAKTGSTITFSYEVVAAAPAAGTPTTVDVPIWAFAGSLADVGTLGVTVHLAPISTVTTQSATAGILRFVDAPVTGTASIASCITALLYPFVTNKLGFDTGIAIANMGQDNKGTSSQSGSCTLTFWDGTTTGTTPTATTTLGPLTAGQSVTTLVSTAAAGFQGYAIAKCNFQFAHGFAIVVNGFGSTAGPSIGSVYLALVNNDTRSGTLTAGVESISQ